MTFSKQHISSGLKWLLILIIFGSLLLFIRQTNFAEVAKYLQLIGFGYVYIILVTLVAMLMGTIAWRYTFDEGSIEHIPFLKLFTIRLVGENIGLLNPSNIIGGDAYKGYLLSKEGVPYHKSTSSIVLSRMIMMSTQILTFIVAALIFAVVVEESALLKWITIGAIVLILLLAGVGYLILMFGLTGRGVRQLLTRLGWRSLIYKFKKIYVQLRSLYRNHKKRFYKAVGFNVLNWLIGSLEFWLIFYFLSTQISVLDALLVDQGVLVLKSFGAFIPGQLGVEEFSNKVMLSIVGIKATGLWVAASIVRRSRQLFWIIVSGLLFIIIKREQQPIVALSHS